jgi:hypothetical protein
VISPANKPTSSVPRTAGNIDLVPLAGIEPANPLVRSEMLCPLSYKGVTPSLKDVGLGLGVAIDGHCGPNIHGTLRAVGLWSTFWS